MISQTEKRAKELRTMVRNISNKPTAPVRYTPMYQAPAPGVTDVDLLRIKREILDELKGGKDFQLTPDMVREIIQMMKTLPMSDRLEVQDIRNHQAFMYQGTKYGVHEMMHGGSSSTSAAISVITVSGTVDDSNTSFTAASEPTLLNINGGFYQQTGGTFTWSYAGGTITLNSPVGTGGQIYGI